MEMNCNICNKDFENKEALDMHNSQKHNIPLENGKTKINKELFFVLGILFVVAIGSYFFISKPLLTGYATKDINEIQKITLSFKNYNYYPNEIKVKEGIPVEITLDNSIGGCFRSFNIKELGVSKISNNPNQKITFTPSKKGVFEFACSMRMGRGTIVVE